MTRVPAEDGSEHPRVTLATEKRSAGRAMMPVLYHRDITTDALLQRELRDAFPDTFTLENCTLSQASYVKGFLLEGQKKVLETQYPQNAERLGADL